MVARRRCSRGTKKPARCSTTSLAQNDVVAGDVNTITVAMRPTATRRVRRKVKFVIAPERRGAISVGCWRHDSLDRRLTKRDMCCAECTKAHKVFDRRSEDVGVSWQVVVSTSCVLAITPIPSVKDAQTRGRRSVHAPTSLSTGVQMARYYFHVRRGRVSIVELSRRHSLPHRPSRCVS